MNKKTWIGGTLLIATVFAWLKLPALSADDDKAAVKAQLAAFVDAWNRHDGKALAALHTEDADSTAPGRGKLSGRAAIEKFFVDTHTGAGQNRDSKFEATIDSIRFPSAEVAISDKTVVLSGVRKSDGSKSPPMTLEVTEVWTKSGGKWLIYACRIRVKEASSPDGGASDKLPKGVPGDFAEKSKEWEKMKSPGPQHGLLKTFEGTWVGTGTWTEAGATSTFTEHVSGRMLFDGRFLQFESKDVRASPMMPLMTTTSLILVGFDNAKQKFVQTMVGDGSTSLGAAEGTYDSATRTLTMAGVEILAPGKERKYRLVQKNISKDGWSGELYITQPDGNEAKVGEAVYKRK